MYFHITSPRSDLFLHEIICHITSALTRAARAKSIGMIVLPELINAAAIAMQYTETGSNVINTRPVTLRGILNGRSSVAAIFLSLINATYSRKSAAPYSVISIMIRSPNVHKTMPLTTTEQHNIDM